MVYTLSMNGIVEEVKKEVTAERDAEDLRKVKAFIRTKLARLKAIEGNIGNLEDEMKKIQDSLDRVDEGDHTDVTNEYNTVSCPYTSTVSCGTADLNGNQFFGNHNNKTFRY